MSGVNTIFFDFGGVLLVHMDGIDHKAVEAKLGLPERTLFDCLYRESRYRDFQVGGCTHDDWIESIRAAAAKRLETDAVDAFMEAWQNAERLLNEDMLALVGRLRANGYTTGIISNTIPGMEARLQGETPHLIQLFDIRIGSGDVKLAKPDPAIFHHALEQAGAEPHQAVFADDVSAYARAARDVGMHGFHFTGYEQFAEDLRSIGVRH
ncbi:MAG TPA: HAD family phosphatase [Dehalococcoidia bacterium]|nr:HAD family phosphatase [Dehalococcoidia bacterium]